jgi:hypothetical protein
VRGLLGILAGVVAAVAAMMLISFIGTLAFPAPARIDTSNVEAIKATYSSLNMGGRMLVLADWFLGALVGAAVAKRLIGRPWAAWTVAGLIEAYVLLSVLMLPMPGWMQIVALVAPLVGGFLANHLVPDRLEAAIVDGEEPAVEGTGADVEA